MFEAYAQKLGGKIVTNGSRDIFNEIEKKSSLSVEDIYRIAQSIQHADFSNEQTVRKIVRYLSQMTQRSISQEKEDAIVSSIINNDMPQDIDSLRQFFK